jgi:type I restriction enzyme S subunit
MNKKTNKLIPELRFPEFLNDGDWSEEIVENIAKAESSSVAFNKLDIKKQGYPVYGADSIVGYIDSYQHKEEYISIVKDGSGVGRLNFCKSESTILGTLISLKSKDEKKYNLNWIYYLLNTIDFSSYVKGGGIPHIYYSDYKNEKVLVPNPSEQQKIASCLSSLDELLTSHTNKLETLKTYKKGLMQNLFPQEGEKAPKLRFKEFEKDGKWVETKLGNIGNPSMCKRIFKEETTSDSKNGIPFYKIGTFGKEADSYISKEIYEEYKRKYSFPKKGDILISASGTIGRLVVYDGEPAFFQDSNIVWIDNDESKTTNGFLFYAYSLLNWQTSDGGIIQRLYNADLKGMIIRYPKNKQEQQKIADTLSSLDDLIKEQSNKIEQLKLHKKGLMQGLFPKVKK